MRLLLADDHDLVRSTLAGLLREHGGYEVTEASDMWQGFSQIEAGPKPDLALLDLSMPGMSLPEGLARAVKMMAPAPVALLTGTGTHGVARRAMDLGAKGFLTKNMLPEELLVNVRKLLGGETVVVDQSAMEDDGTEEVPHLTPRELDVLRGLCNGLSNKEIARELDVQEVTVKLHVKTLSRKLDAKNRTHAAMLGRDMHLV